MQVTELSRLLGVSRQILHRHIKRGCPTDSLQAAIEWRKRNLDFTQTKTWRIDGNKGVKFSPRKPSRVNESATDMKKVYSDAKKKIIKETLTDTVPNLYFERVDWLAMALKDVGVPVTGAQIMEIQDNLFSTYLEEIVYGHFQIDSHFDLPPLSSMRLDSRT